MLVMAAAPNNSTAAVNATLASSVASEQQPVSKSGGSILQELCSRQPKSYVTNNPAGVTNAGASVQDHHGHHEVGGSDSPMAPGSPSLKMKIKRSNSTSSRGQDEEPKAPSSTSSSSSTSSEAANKKAKKRKATTGPTNSRSSTSSSRSSSPR